MIPLEILEADRVIKSANLKTLAEMVLAEDRDLREGEQRGGVDKLAHSILASYS